MHNQRQYRHENSMHVKQAHASTEVITQYGVSIFGAWVQNNAKHGRPGGCIVWEGSKYSKHRRGEKRRNSRQRLLQEVQEVQGVSVQQQCHLSHLMIVHSLLKSSPSRKGWSSGKVPRLAHGGKVTSKRADEVKTGKQHTPRENEGETSRLEIRGSNYFGYRAGTFTKSHTHTLLVRRESVEVL